MWRWKRLLKPQFTPIPMEHRVHALAGAFVSFFLIVSVFRMSEPRRRMVGLSERERSGDLLKPFLFEHSVDYFALCSDFLFCFGPQVAGVGVQFQMVGSVHSWTAPTSSVMAQGVCSVSSFFLFFFFSFFFFFFFFNFLFLFVLFLFFHKNLGLEQALGPPGTRQPENSKRAFQNPDASNTTKIQRKDPQEREDRMKAVAEGGKKKTRNFGPPTFQPFPPPPSGSPALRGPIFLGSGLHLRKV